MKQIDEKLAGREWFSDQYSVLDPYGFVFYTWGVRRELPMGELKNYTAFKDRMVKRPAVERVHGGREDQGLIAASSVLRSWSSKLGSAPSRRAPGLPGSRLILHKSGRPDLGWGRAGEGGGACGQIGAPTSGPPPQPLPTRGRGAHRARGNCSLKLNAISPASMLT